MITRMEVFSSQADAPELPLGGFMPNDDPVQVKDIEGLGPVKADITSTAFATRRGELFQGASTGKRNIVLTLGLNPDWAGRQTMSSLRQILYRYFMPQQWCKLRFFSDELPTVDIEGTVESFEPNIFSQDPEIQISILNFEPDFIDADATIITGVVDDGTIESVFDYIGTVNTGFELKIVAAPANAAYTGDFTIGMTAFGVLQTFEVTPVTVDGTYFFKLTTVESAKSADIIATADGAITNLMPYVTPASVWPQIQPGENVLTVKAGEDGQAWTLAYFNRFGGL